MTHLFYTHHMNTEGILLQPLFCSALSGLAFLACPAWPSLPPLNEQSLLDLNCSLHQFFNHPKISVLINQRDEDIFRYLTNLQVRPKRLFTRIGQEIWSLEVRGAGGKGPSCGGDSIITPTLSRYRISDISPWATK